ncbi:serine hydrolase domain-containing protein [Sinorhizobium meliloti]|uniref:serine hydrolase domain-containing protein n=1 Tax=Rhizobium meliloti TaxID=382 RepID=UPI001F2E9E47|nr:serine hydrolase [Sinorhizobium meliloti]
MTDMLKFEGKYYPDGRASDPREMGWMRGAPPDCSKRITFESDTFLDFPKIRWSLSHMRELTATANIRCDRVNPSHFVRSDRTAEIEALSFIDETGKSHGFVDALYDTYTDGLLVLHRGRIVYERYFGALEPQVPHACHSITKSYAGTLAASLVHEGVLDDNELISHYLPELEATAWRDASLRQVMDMQTGLAYSEDYSVADASIWSYARASGWRPRPPGYVGPRNLCDYIQSIDRDGIHGANFSYKSVNTDVMTWVMERVTGTSFPHLLHDRIWSPLGCEEDGYMIVDAAGMAMSGAGLSATLRDLSRFGELMRCNGSWEGKQVVPASVMHDILTFDEPSKFSGNFSYRSMWWIPKDELGGFLAAGIHGQRLYVLPEAETVIARFASHPVASGAANEAITYPQMLALVRLLSA